MSGGSPAAPAPVKPTFTDPVNGMSFMDSAALNNEIADRMAQEKQTSDVNAADVVNKQNQNKLTFDYDLGKGAERATGNVNQYLTDNGYDPNRFSGEVGRAINNAQRSIIDPSQGDTTHNVSTYAPTVDAAFSPNLGAQILQQINSGYQSRAGGAVDKAFAPTYSQDSISNDWLAPAQDSVLSSQFDPLNDQLSNSLKRGTLNDTGYAAALKALGTARTGAASTVSHLGENILNNDRSGVDNYITGARNDAANVNANSFDNFDVGKYITGAHDLVGRDQANFAGDLQNAIGKTSFSSLGELLNAGGVVQGANDPSATNPSAGVPGGGGISDAFIAQQALAGQKRGLGSSGAF